MANTYAYDEELPSLPLPPLHETLERYYESLQPFGNAEELKNAREKIELFRNGIGRKLQSLLEERAKGHRNWLEEWWDRYAYHSLRAPLNPYIVMATTVKLEFLQIPETPDYALKNLARLMYHSMEFWQMLHRGELKPMSTHNGQVKYSSALYKRFYSTTRVPGVEVDHIKRYFKTTDEGMTPTHCLISGKGRLFIFDCLSDQNKCGNIINPFEILVLLQRLRAILDYEPKGSMVPILTHDERTAWAKNRQYLIELSPNNAKTMELIESSNLVVVFDDNEPQNYADTSRLAVSGDYHSKWGDRSSTLIGYKNGKFACVGEHSSYDGTISVSYMIFIHKRLKEMGEPNWSNYQQDQTSIIIPTIKELKFDIDDKIRFEINRVAVDCDKRRHDVLVTHEEFLDYGRNYIKKHHLHPDSFVQVLLQVAYAIMHQEIASTYETALMRHFYNGRTETLRSCTTDVFNFIDDFQNRDKKGLTLAELKQSFFKAVDNHNFKMNEARKGHGVDRHLFGLWCLAEENKLETPDIFYEPLFFRSGGGGNFVLSTSTLGSSVNVGYVAPMITDGYGIFYTITANSIIVQISTYRESTKTSGLKLNEHLFHVLRMIKNLLDGFSDNKNQDSLRLSKL